MLVDVRLERQPQQVRGQPEDHRHHHPRQQQRQPHAPPHVGPDGLPVPVVGRLGQHREQDEIDGYQELVRQEREQLAGLVDPGAPVRRRRRRRPHQPRLLGGAGGQITQQRHVALHQRVQEKLPQRQRPDRRQVHPEGRGTRSTFTHTCDPGSDGEDGEGGEGKAGHGAQGAEAFPQEQPGADDHGAGAERGVHGVEEGLTGEEAASVEGTDEGGVEGVSEDDEARGQQQGGEVAGPGGEDEAEGQGQEEGGEGQGQAGVDAQGASVSAGLLLLGGLGDEAAGPLDGAGDDHVVGDVGDGARAGERPVGLGPQQGSEEPLLHEADQHEVDLGAADGEAAPASGAGGTFPGGGRGGGHSAGR